MGILIALIPAIAWGSIGLISGHMGGSARQQTLGMTMGALVFGIVLWLFKQPVLNSAVWATGIISGLFWSVGQGQQFTSMKAVGISRTTPISTGMQLVANALAGVLLFNEWHGRMYWIGSISVIVLIFGAVLTSLTDKTDPNVQRSENWSVGIRALILSTVGYAGYTIVVHYGNVNAQAVVMPQAVGMLIGALIWSFKDRPWKETATYRNIVTGLVWGIGNLFMFMAMAQIGQAIAYSLSQMGIVISTFGSIYLLGERKTHREMIYVIIGSILVIVGGVALSLMKA
ncbi:GRP family sugar transporter [Lactiplantibacillus mudanjiangensis]|uniref:Sugar transport protein [Lactobacillus plantarum JDM1] n=1 Tax=Lactiplantibacillus mudanjiangensis TaxID=1296538 RepID=A0A660E184_9LACO|nr:GRP family sugar transporter [Lactiplantibacillus mudanjiangensis]VDG19107.1 sugar transport protein [Lactobacillus plantarum JDM1] [Lactiplantibacillus mudanjiangensis]VDG23193.1 sugar transport protein [Lactobacillus plantarum JDM1] [Lactiplantibacillus mudanjiangensis]VDG29881.1 sugar transport protein [Lactobacillus plantarum JDM1] [Lactiplantibacillus mudanjiangensis]VDG33180.1 sugar transport protein [Lactobacillus plantarum JDM1] [Lactiplantibacillus mudanjiangensis]